MENCKLFSKKINCDLNATVQECEDAKTSLIKYCKSKECPGVFHSVPGGGGGGLEYKKGRGARRLA